MKLRCEWADHLVAFGESRAEKGALLRDLKALHRENLATAERMRARLDNIANRVDANRVDAIRNALTLTT
ncbi:UNVERIFIED_ORG: hypothetical protein GGI63_005244 [Rhizobium esperanzae]